MSVGWRQFKVLESGQNFTDFQKTAAQWITFASGEFYPDILQQARELYQPVQVLFGQTLERSDTSEALLSAIAEVSEPWMRVQLCRIFRKFVSPTLPVEMLKRKTALPTILAEYGNEFRALPEVHARFKERPCPDEVLCALLWEYKDRGKRGYDLTERFFRRFAVEFPQFKLEGPIRGGKDILLHNHLPGYVNKTRPVDFVIYRKKTLAGIGFAHYDSDRGGSQEDSRIGEYRNAADEINRYLGGNPSGVKILFLNDGPGLLLGSMWRDYGMLEQSGDNILVFTLRMMNQRFTKDWLLSRKSLGS